MDRDPHAFQTVENGRVISIADASRQHLEQEVMRAYDVFQHLETSLIGPLCLVSAFIDGKARTIDDSLSPSDGTPNASIGGKLNA